MEAANKPRKPSLSAHADAICGWMVAGATFQEVVCKLESERGLKVTTAQIHAWWHRRKRQQFEQDIERALMEQPNLGNLVKAVRVMLARYAMRDKIGSEDLKAIGAVLRPLIEFETFRRQTCEMFVDFAKDEELRGLAVSDGDRNEKIRRLHLAIFGEEVAA